MTDEAKRIMVQTLLGNDSEATNTLIDAYLSIAKQQIMARRYPMEQDQTGLDFPSNYDLIQVQLAQRYFLRRGAEGETIHNENGVNRTYDSTNDEDLLKEVMQLVKY